MAAQDATDPVDVTTFRDHLTEALDCAENESAKYHLREACQKVVILEEEK